MKTTEPARLTVYFDGLCPLCSREIAHYRAQDREGRIAFVDITAPGFDASSEGLDVALIHKLIHVRRPDGEVRTAVDAFIEIWRELPRYRWLARAASPAPIRFLLRIGYAVFARVRPWLPRRKRKDCETGTCAR